MSGDDEPGYTPSLEDEPDLYASVTAALREMDLQASDGAARRLALQYASLLEGASDPADIVRLGRGLLSVLESLGMTPRARAALARKGGVSGRNDLAAHRARRRRAREHGAPPVDSASS
jgi:hypothetical protein